MDPLTAAIEDWERAAAHALEDGNPGAARIYARAAAALRQEQQTGQAVCSCCFRPF